MYFKKMISSVIISVMSCFIMAVMMPGHVVYSQKTLEDDLILYNTFEAGTISDNKILDQSGSGNNGTINGDVKFVEGFLGQAVYIDNPDLSAGSDLIPANNYVSYGKSIRFEDKDFTLSFWFKADNYGADNSAIISNKKYDSGANPGFAIGNFASSGTRVNFNTSGSSRSDIYAIPANDGNWNYYTVVFDRSKGSIEAYLNGAHVETASISNHNGKSIDTDHDLVLGACGTLTNGVQRTSIDELRIYKRALNTDEINSLYMSYSYEDVLRQLQERVDAMEPNYEYTEKMIDQMKQNISRAWKDIEKAGNLTEIISIMDRLKEEYNKFLIGSEANMAFFATADHHLMGSTTHIHNTNLEKGIQDMVRIDPNAPFIAAGDFSEYGTDVEVDNFYNILNQYWINNKVVNVLGNHEARGGRNWNDPSGEYNPRWQTGYWNTIYSLYMKHNKKYMPDTDGKVYFAREFGDYQIIALNTERDYKDWAHISPEQAQWLDDVLKQGDQTKPAFIVLHQPLSETVWRSDAWSAGDEANEIVRDVLKKHPRAVLMAGHIHNGLGTTEAVERSYGTMVEIPAFNKSENGYTTKGAGFYVKVYDEAIVFKARNFVTSTWLPEYDIVVKLPTLAVTYKKANDLVASDYTESTWEKVNVLLGETEKIFNMKYEAVGTSVYSAPPVFLFGSEVRAGIADLTLKINEAIDGLQLRKVNVTNPAIPTKPGAAKVSDNSIKISWNSGSGAGGTEVWYSTSKEGTYKKVYTSTGNYYIHKNLETGRTYYYKVRSCKKVDGMNYYSAYTDVKSVTLSVPKPKGVKLKVNADKKSIRISWEKVAGAYKYEIYRAAGKNGKYRKIKTVSGKKLSYTNKKLKKGRGYHYKVKTVQKVGKKICRSGFSARRYAEVK